MAEMRRRIQIGFWTDFEGRANNDLPRKLCGWQRKRGVEGDAKDPDLSNWKEEVSFAETEETSWGSKFNCTKPECSLRKGIATFRVPFWQ